MARLLMVAVALVGSVLADDSSYAAPTGSYGAPAGYAAPSAPADNYGVPTYGEPSGYGPPADAGGDGFNLDKILELLPFFLAVFAAIIVAQLLAPLIGVLFSAKVGLLAPLAGAKLDLINAVLGPFGLAICNIGPPLTVAGNAGRSNDASGFSLNPELVDLITGKLYQAIESYSN